MATIIPRLIFNNNAEPAINFYTSVFPNSSITRLDRHQHSPATQLAPELEDKIVHGEFTLDGYQFIASDGGPMFQFSGSLSLVVNCYSTNEIDALWDRLSEGGHILTALEETTTSPREGSFRDKFDFPWKLRLVENPPHWLSKIAPFILFRDDTFGQAEQAMNYYTDFFFPASQQGTVIRSPRNGFVVYEEFKIENMSLAARDFPMPFGEGSSNSISFTIVCDGQDDVDYYWQLSAFPDAEACIWFKDKYGFSWNLAPRQLATLLNSVDGPGREHLLAAMGSMKKLDLAQLSQIAQA